MTETVPESHPIQLLSSICIREGDIESDFIQKLRDDGSPLPYTRKRLCFVQLFIISNRDSTYSFTNALLNKCDLSRMISRYMVLMQSEQKRFMMCPFHTYAVQAIVESMLVLPGQLFDSLAPKAVAA